MITPTIFVLFGLPGSGKSTLAKEMAERENARIYSYDAMPGANTKAERDGSVKKAWIEEMQKATKAGENIVCDALHLTAQSRKEILNAFSNIPCRKVLLTVITPISECLKRNARRKERLPDFVILQAAQRIEVPTYEEGWDEIHMVKETEKVFEKE